MVRIPSHREPTHPGEMLLNEFLLPLGMTQRALANAIQVPYQRVNEVVVEPAGLLLAPHCGSPNSSATPRASG